MRKKQLTRERIFRNNKVVLSSSRRDIYAIEEFIRQAQKTSIFPSKTFKNLGINNLTTCTLNVDIYDPYTCVALLSENSTKDNIKGYSKRMPNDVPNDCIAIQVAVSRLIKRLKNG